jgi:hypothetical protein
MLRMCLIWSLLAGCNVVYTQTAPISTEQVPVEVAWVHLFLTLFPADGESQDRLQARQAAYVRHIGLTPEQGEKVLVAASSFKDQTVLYGAAVKAVLRRGGAGARARSDVAAELSGLQQERHRAVLELAAQVLLQLGPEGADRLSRFVNYQIKPNIRLGASAQSN